MESQSVENVVRSYLLGQKPAAHHIRQKLATDTFSGRPEPDESFEFSGGTVVVEYESGAPRQSVLKYWWLLNNTDYLQKAGKLALVVLGLDTFAQPVDQVERQKMLAQKLADSFPGKFSFFFVGANELSLDTVSAAIADAYEVVKA